MNPFSLKTWGRKLVQAAVTAIAAVVLGPKVAPVLGPVFDAAGWELTPEKVQAAVWVVLLSGANWLKYQAWTPKLVRRFL